MGSGKSLPVKSVQEIVRIDPQSVPERYIQENKDRPLISEIFHASSLEIPIIDFSLLVKGDEHERRRLDLACNEWGFFQITNHGVEVKVLHKMKAAVAAFFDLPLKEKEKKKYGQQMIFKDMDKSM